MSELYNPESIPFTPQWTGVWVEAADTGRTLFLLRSRFEPLQPYVWGWPGGGPERGESLLEGALREFWEETGYEGSLTITGEIRLEDFKSITYRVTVPREFIPRLNFEHASWTWVGRPIPIEALHPGVVGAQLAWEQE